MATSSVCELVRQSPVTNSGPESAALFSKSLPEYDSSQLWLASSPLTSTTESLSDLWCFLCSQHIIRVSCCLNWDQGHVYRTVVQLECQLSGCPMQGELEVECWAAHWHHTSGPLKFWSGDRSECFTHWASGINTRLSSSREKPWKKPHQISLPHLREDLPEGGIHLLSHPGPLVLLSPKHLELLVLISLGQTFPLDLIIFGQPFQFKGQPLFKLSFGLGDFL